MLEEASGQAWNASLERAHWQISLSEGQAPIGCQEGLWDPDDNEGTGEPLIAQPLPSPGSTPVLEQVSRAFITALSRVENSNILACQIWIRC